jgi:hypothetical protein
VLYPDRFGGETARTGRRSLSIRSVPYTLISMCIDFCTLVGSCPSCGEQFL